MTDGSWVDLPIGNKIAAHKHPLNLAHDEVLQFQDLNATRAPGSLSLRKISEKLHDRTFLGNVVRIGQQNRPDGNKRLALVAQSTSESQNRLYVQKDNGEFETSFGSIPNLNLGNQSADLSISPDTIRACGKDGLAVVLKIGAIPVDGEIKPFDPDANLAEIFPLPDYVGIGYVAWDGIISTKVSHDTQEIYALDSWAMATTEIVVYDEDADIETWFSGSDRAVYFASFTYQGGQESVPSLIASRTMGGDDRNGVILTVYVKYHPSAQVLPHAITQINIYRALNSGLIENAVLVASFDFYKNDSSFRSWQRDDTNFDGIYYWRFIEDRNQSSVIGGTYFDRQQLSHKVTELSPYRRHQRLFSDRLFAWDVVADDGKIYGNRLYYSHINGLGISCYDIIPPANYVEVPFNILGLVSVRSHRIIIGDSKYAIGYFSGGAIQNWRVYESETEMGCRAPESIADTPFGAAYVGYDGIYVLNGLESTGPIARGIIYSTESEYDWSNARGEFSQDDQEYIVLVPSLVMNRNDPLLVAINLRDGGIRKITGIEQRHMTLGKDSSGKVLLAGVGIYRLEAAYGEGIAADTPRPVIETGLRRFVQGHAFQKIKNVAIQGSWGPGSLTVTVTSHSGVESSKTLPAQEDGLITFGLDSDVSPSYAHKFKFEYVTKPDQVIESFQIDRVWVDVQPCERGIK